MRKYWRRTSFMKMLFLWFIDNLTPSCVCPDIPEYFNAESRNKKKKRKACDFVRLKSSHFKFRRKGNYIYVGRTQSVSIYRFSTQSESSFVAIWISAALIPTYLPLHSSGSTVHLQLDARLFWLNWNSARNCSFWHFHCCYSDHFLRSYHPLRL